MQQAIPSTKTRCWADICDTSSVESEDNRKMPFVCFEDVGRLNQYRGGYESFGRSYLNIIPNWELIKKAKASAYRPWCLVIGSQRTFQNFVHWINHWGLWEVFGTDGFVHLRDENDFDEWVRVSNGIQL